MSSEDYDIEPQGDLQYVVRLDDGEESVEAWFRLTPEVLAQLGKPYNSTKGRAGSGLGLFLTVNVARTLGGRVMAGNRPEGGAVVVVTLPLSAITLKEGEGRVG